MVDIALQEIMNSLDEMVHKTKMDLDRLTRELAKLENQREDLFGRLSSGSPDEITRQKLEETEEKIDKLKKKRSNLQKRSSRKIKELFLTAENFRNDKIDELKKKYEDLAEERDALRDEVIPELQQEVQDLTVKKTNLDGQLLTITSEINELRRFSIETPSLY